MLESAIARGRTPTISLRLPKNPNTRASLLLIRLLHCEDLVEQDPLINAKLLLSVLMTSIDQGVIIELKNELVKRFP